MEERPCVSLVPLFSDLSLGEQREIMKLAHHRTYEKGELVFQPGDERLDIVARGSIKVYQLSAAGKEQLLRVVEPGSYEGEKQLFGIANETLFGEALEPTKVCTLSKWAFNQVLLCNPDISLKLFELTAQKMVQVENQARFLSMERVEERLADYLLGMAKAEGKDQITLPMRMMDIAEYLGTTPETLSRKLKRLEDAGYIARTGRKVTLLDKGSLQNI